MNIMKTGDHWSFCFRCSEIYEKYQNQFPVTIYPSEWFEVIDDCRLNLNNDNQVLFPDQYGEHTFDKRTKVNEFISNLEVHIND
jgi:hypothetical protein